MRATAHRAAPAARTAFALAFVGALALGLAPAGCVTEPTEVLVIVGVDLPSDAPVTLRASVRDGASMLGFDGAADVTFRTARDGGGLEFPASFGLTPRPGAARDVSVTVQVEATSGAVVMRRVARFRFVPHQISTLRIFLTPACAAVDQTCANVACSRTDYCESMGQTCGDYGDCVPVDVMLGTGDAGGFDVVHRDVPPAPDVRDVARVTDVPPADVPRDIPVVDVPAPACGDGTCNGSDTTCNCPSDCGTSSSDGCCNGGENSCNDPGECGTNPSDGCCSGGENSCNDPGECGTNPNDGCCNGGENSCNDPGECGTNPGDGCCNGGENTCNDPGECGTNPSDGCCNGGENCSNAPTDCGCGLCRVDCCGGGTGFYQDYVQDQCVCRGMFMSCINAGKSTYQIHYNGTLIYERCPNGTSYCGTGSQQRCNSCSCGEALCPVCGASTC